MKEAVRLCYTAALEAALGKPHDAEADLRIALTISHPEAAAECSWLAPSSGGGGWQRRGRGRRDGRAQQQQEQQPELPALTPAVVQRLAALSQADFAASCPAAAAQLACPAAATVRLQARRKPVHVGGRYLKLRRGIPQSPWFIDGQRKGEGSVQVRSAGLWLLLVAGWRQWGPHARSWPLNACFPFGTLLLQEAIEQVVLPALQADSYTLVSAGGPQLPACKPRLLWF